MKKYWIAIAWILSTFMAGAEPIRVAVLDFENKTGASPDDRLGGLVQGEALAQKGVYLMGKHLVNGVSYTLVDRRDFVAQIEKIESRDNARIVSAKPTFLHAAQIIGADVVLRGNLLSFSTGKRLINQGGFRTEFSTLSLRVSLEALDATDGSILALSDGGAKTSVRQTEADQTVLGEDEVLDLFDDAIEAALPDLDKALTLKWSKKNDRETVKFTVKSDVDPALVELDGVLIGTTPLENFEVYKGDHVLTVSKAGHRDVTKRILFKGDMSIEVPMIRTELNAEELKEVLNKARLHAFSGIEPALIIHTESGSGD
ncbi:MAG: PEGA domain-containing protein [Verrucomicrobiota bacterium]